MAFIYALIDPRTDEIRYIGKTCKSLPTRLRGHIEKSKKNKWHTARWIRSLIDIGLVPVIEAIRTVDEQYLSETEIFCIDEYKRLGCRLTNTAIGGVGGVTGNYQPRSIEHLRAIVATEKGSAWHGKTQPPEVVEARMAGYTPEKRAAAIRKAKETRARRKAVAEAFGVNLYSHPSPLKGTTLTDEQKELSRAGAKAQWAGYSEEEAQAHKQRLRGEFEKFIEKVRTGEIEHPNKGNSYTVGFKHPPESHQKQWETRRANGFVSQRQMIEKVAAEAGESVSKTDRALKGYDHKVSREASERIWAAYEKMKADFPGLTVVYPKSSA